MNQAIQLEKSYQKDYRFLPSRCFEENIRAKLTMEDLFFLAALREVEGAAAGKKKWDQESVYFDITVSTMRKKYGLSPYRTRLSLKNLYNAGIITDPSDKHIRILKEYSGYEKNKDFSAHPGYHSRSEEGIRIPRCLDQFTSLKSQDRIIFCLLLDRCMKTRICDISGLKTAQYYHEEMMEQTGIRSLATLLSAYDRLESVGLIHRVKKSFTFTFPMLSERHASKNISFGKDAKPSSSIHMQTEELSGQKTVAKTFMTQEDQAKLFFSNSIFDSNSASVSADTIKRNTNTDLFQNSLSSDQLKIGRGSEDEGNHIAEKQDILAQIGADDLEKRYPNHFYLIDSIAERMLFAYNCRADKIRVGGSMLPADQVRSRMNLIDQKAVESMIIWMGESLKNVSDQGKDNYILTCLYNYERTKDWKHSGQISREADDRCCTEKNTYNSGYKDNRYIQSHNYDFSEILRKNRENLYRSYQRRQSEGTSVLPLKEKILV